MEPKRRDSTCNYLSNEIITSILARLPVKSLLRFKSVSKSWFSMISRTNLIDKHLVHSSSSSDRRHLLLFIPTLHKNKFYECRVESIHNERRYQERRIIPRGFESIGREFVVRGFVGSCNGLVCLCLRDQEELLHFLLWNPSTGDHRLIREVATSDVEPGLLWGIGYDDYSREHKVVLCAGLSKLFVRKLSKDHWRDAAREIPSTAGLKKSYPVDRAGQFVGGFLHWFVALERLHGSDTSGWYVKAVLSFGLRSEKCTLSFIPCCDDRTISGDSLGVLDGSLCLVCGRDLWVWKELEEPNSWIKMYTFPISILSPPFSRSESGELLLHDGNHLVLYNPKSLTLKYVPDRHGNLEFIAQTIVYVESLVSPHGKRS